MSAFLVLLRSEGELPTGAREVLSAEALDFLRAGGTLSLADWDAMRPEGRSAFISAGAVLERERGEVRAAALADLYREALAEARSRTALSDAADAAVRAAEEGAMA